MPRVPELDVIVVNRQRGHRISSTALGSFLRRLVEIEPAVGVDSLAVRLVSDVSMRRLNREFRGKDQTTDVLSFPAGDEPQPPGEKHLGDIAIAVPTAARQAREARHSLAREVKLLSLHGYLHLLGYDHATDQGTMRRLERRLEHRLFDRLAPGAR